MSGAAHPHLVAVAAGNVLYRPPLAYGPGTVLTLPADEAEALRADGTVRACTAAELEHWRKHGTPYGTEVTK